VATVKPETQNSITRRRPKRAARKPVTGVAMAVARMLKVVVQAISSGVAAMLPCICGSSVEATRRVVAYSVDASTTDAMTMTRRASGSARRSDGSDIGASGRRWRGAAGMGFVVPLTDAIQAMVS
jgi:hypothetical protein